MFKKLEPAFDWSGTKQLTADAGTVKGEKKLMFKCECGGYVVWVKSKKTQKNYLANCSEYATNDETKSYWYAAFSPHFKTCDQQASMRKELIASYDNSIK